MSPTLARFVLCFLQRDRHVLMLLRSNPPNRGLWNGIGGHIEPGETPRAACLREVQEEAGYQLGTVRFAGVLTWSGFEISDGGLYLFTAQAPPGPFRACTEGRLAWVPRRWVWTAPAVVSNLHHVAPAVLGGARPREYYFAYRGDQIVDRAVRSLPEWASPDRPW